MINNVEEYPGDVKKIVIVAFSSILLVFFGGIVWSVFAPLEGAIIASGYISVEGDWKSIQHLAGGTVKNILVKEGDLIKKNDLLIQLNDTVENANLTSLDQQLQFLVVQRARLVAESTNKNTFSYDAKKSNINIEIFNGQKQLFQAKQETYRIEQNRLKQKLNLLDKELSSIGIQKSSYIIQRNYLTNEVEGYKELYEKGYIPLVKMLQIQRDEEFFNGKINHLEAQLSSVEAKKDEVKLEIIHLKKKRIEEALNELRQVDSLLFELRSRYTAARETVDRLNIVAPMSGRILGLTVHTVGGIIVSGSKLMYIVPNTAKKNIIAKVKPEDIDKVFQNSDVTIRFSAFNRKTTPVAFGKVTVISGDSLIDDNTGEKYYRIEILLNEMASNYFENKKLLPGMPVECFIKTEPRTALSYLLKPIVDALQRAFRD